MTEARRLGRFGIWRSASQVTPELAAGIERLGFGALWLGSSPAVAAGRLIWLSFAANLGAAPAPVVIAWVIAAIALGTVLAANALAIGPSLTGRAGSGWQSPRRSGR